MQPIDIADELEQSIQRHPTLGMRMFALALQALSSRALIWCAFVGALVLWIMAMQAPDALKIGVAVGYCITVLLPLLVVDAKSA
jgi:hypothetical protein